MRHYLMPCATDKAAFPIVRVYQWDRPSVSIGRLQNRDMVRDAFPGLPIVRRPTGGLAVRHGDDLTISVITRDVWLPGRQGRGVLSSYRQIVSGLLSAFAASGLQAALGGTGSVRERGVIDCFASAAACDAIDTRTGRKVMGCAQRREDGAILQQMSIPCACLSDMALFVRAAQAGLGRALSVKEWLVR